MNNIVNLINEYPQICIYRHVNPDMDAFGSQFGFYDFLIQNFKDKNIVLMGEFTSNLLKMYDRVEYNTIKDLPTLAIVLDTANSERIDGDISFASKIIKIDHHIIVDQYGDINIVDEKASSCAQVITSMLKDTNYTLSKKGASALYIGIVGDSNRFLYTNTDARTFLAASYLLSYNIDIDTLYQKMYLREEKDLRVTKFILNNYIVKGKVAYYILKDEDLNDLNISREEGSNYVNTLANIKEFEVWMAITENKINNNVRVSIRSRKTPVNDIASKYNGGGHYLASGATLNSLLELDDLIKDLQNAISKPH